jgi:virginiamycin B lyase
MLKSGGLTSCFAAAAFVAFVFWPSAGLTQDGVGTLTGVVTDAAGAPREGAFVQMKNAERRLYFMVITKAQGRYTNTRLPPGEYVVQAIGGEHQSAPSIPVEVAAGRSSSVDLSLTVARAPALPPAWPGRQPGQRGAAPETASLAPGEGKAIVEAKCLSCHDAQRIVRSRGNQTRWRQVLHSMKLYAQGSTFAQALTDNEDKVVLAYLAANYAPASGGAKAKPDPFSRLPRTLVPPAARDYIVVEYEMPNPRSEPHEVAVDREGNGWVTQRTGGRLGKLDRKSLTYVEYEPPAAASTHVRLNGIRTGNEGELWMIDGGPNRRWLSFDPKTERFAVYDLPPTRSGNASGNTMRVHPNNTVWLNSIGANEVIRLDPATKQFTFFEVPAGVKRNRNASPYGMAVGGDGKIWIVENSVDQIARIDPATGKFDEFPLSVKDPVARKLGSDWDGNLWVGLHGAGSLLRVDYKTLQMMEFTPPSEDSGVYLADADMTNRVIWTSLHHVDKLGRLDPATGVWTEFPLMYAETDVRRIEVDPNNPKRVWYSGVLSGRIGYIEMLQ